MATLLTPPARAQSRPRRQIPDLKAMLHKVDPYVGFDAAAYPFDPQGWNGNSELFGRLVAELQPQLAIEVGTWKGQSAINTARHLAAQGNGAQLLCIDTWLGSLDFWQRRDEVTYDAMQLKHGYPSFYYQFLANVVHAGLQETIVPFPVTSTIAARLLIGRGIQADMVYIDASHEENDAYMDIVYFWHALRPGGVMFGDDYREQYFPGVVRAVAAFCAEQKLQHEVIEGQYWLLRKPG